MAARVDGETPLDSVDFFSDPALFQRSTGGGQQIGLDEVVELAVENGIDVPCLVRGADILHQPVGGEDVASDLATPGDLALRGLVDGRLVLALLNLHLIELGLDHLQRHSPVLKLRSFGTTHHHDPARDVTHSDGGLDLVDVLTAFAPGAHRGRIEIFVFDDDVDLVVDVGCDLDGRERGLTARVGVERGDPHQTVNTVLAAEVAEGVVAGDRERDAVDAGFVAFLEVDDLRLVAAPLALRGS